MASSIADYALIGDLGTAALVSRTGSIDWLCWPRFDSDACFAALLGTPDHGRGPDMAVLRSAVTMCGEDLKTVGDFTVAAGESLPFVLSFGRSHQPLPNPVEPFKKLRTTEDYWQNWTQMSRIDCPWADYVTRSLITLKALTYARTGGLVAAPTTSLPESIGGPRNWDYRFCWLRDATLTLLALMNAGYYDEAQSWRDWLLRAAAGSPSQIQIMYGVRGERRLTEWQVPWLPGYRSSQPVRVGNAAYNQRQLDIFGEVMDALHRDKADLAPTRLAGRCNANCSYTWKRPGESLTRGCGKFVAGLSISRIPRQWLGSLTTALSEVPKPLPYRIQ